MVFYIFLIILLYLVCKYISRDKYTLTIALVSCNRIYYLNLSISSIINHINNYEKDIQVTFINYDQVTPNREDILNKYNLKNIFLINPYGWL